METALLYNTMLRHAFSFEQVKSWCDAQEPAHGGSGPCLTSALCLITETQNQNGRKPNHRPMTGKTVHDYHVQ